MAQATKRPAVMMHGAHSDPLDARVLTSTGMLQHVQPKCTTIAALGIFDDVFLFIYD